jgi:hypothetical protein
MRAQIALEWGTTALIPAVAGSLIVLWLWRMQRLTDGGAIAVLGGLGFAVIAAAIVGASRNLPTHLVATRLDRASGLSDRLASALEFQRRLDSGEKFPPETAALMKAAISDAATVVAKANPKAAAPIKTPTDLGPVAVFAAVALLVSLMAFKPDLPDDASLASLSNNTGKNGLNAADPDEQGLDKDDVDYSKQYVKDLQQMADQTGDQQLKQLAEELEALLDKAEKGEISKEELIAKMDELEKKYMEGSEQDEQAMLDALKNSGKELQKEPLTKRLGEALESGDMDAAQKELERLAEQVEKKELTPQEEKKLAEALEKAAKKQEERNQKEQAQQDKKLQKKKDEVRRLEKKAQQDPKNEDNKRRLEKEKRELERLQREKQEKQEQQEKRSLERLHRKMKSASDNLKNQDKEDRERRRKQAAEDMKEAGKEGQKAAEEMKKLGNQKRAQSQLGDLKDSIRRAKQKKGGGQQKGGGSRQARLQRIREWEGRANGGQGNRGQWKGQGQGQGQQGKGQGDPSKGQGGQKCDDPNGCPGIGDGHDPDLMGDPTKLSGKKKDEQLQGKHGRGPSKRETIITSAKKGFASAGYKQVYAEYKKVVEEVMNEEKVPQGYKYYVKRYFNRIKPHAM